MDQRSAEKQALPEEKIKPYRGKARYKEFEDKLSLGTYKTNKDIKNTNLKYFRNRRKTVAKRLADGKGRQVKADKMKLAEIESYISRIEAQTNDENNSASDEVPSARPGLSIPAPQAAQAPVPAITPLSVESPVPAPAKPIAPVVPPVQSPAILSPTEDVIIKPTLTNGDCFYSGIYRSLNERNLLVNVSACLSLTSVDETSFIQSFRDKIAERIVAGNLQYTHGTHGKVDTYDYLVGLTGNSGSYRQVTNSYPSWFNDEFGENGESLGDRESFIQRLSSHVRNSGEWVGEIEVRLVTQELEKCKIRLEIRSNRENKLYKKSQGLDVIHLYNPSERHYEYFSFDTSNVSIPESTNINEQVPTQPFTQTQQYPVEVKQPCTTLYDPCSGSPITDENPLKVIHKKLHELQVAKRQAHLKDLPVELISSGKPKTRLDLLIWFCNQDFQTIDEDSILNYKAGNNQFSTSLFESYWDIVIALRLLSPFDASGDRYLLDNKVETLNTIDSTSDVFKSKFSKDPLEYLNKRPIQTSSSGGASDITVFYSTKESHTKENDSCLQIKKAPEIPEKPVFFFCSSKLYLKEKTIDKYDIQNIYTAAKQIDPTIYNKEIILLVKNKSSVESTIQTAMRQYLSQEAKYVFGKEDMFSSLRKLYEYIKLRRTSPITPQSLRVILGIDAPILPFLTLRLHQTMAVRIISEAVKRQGRKSNRFLIGILPRGGKTFVAGGLIRELKARRVVVILGAKSETQKQFVDEMFKAFIDFSDYTIVDVKDDASTSIDSTDSSKKYIFVMSIELFKQPNIEHRPLLQRLRSGAGRADLFICDEGHLKQATAKSETAVAGATVAGIPQATVEYDEENETDSAEQLEKLTTLFSGIPVVYMTGTYRKPLLAFDIPPENTVIWDYEDLQRAKSLESEREYFEAAFGKYFIESLDYTISQGNTMEDIMNVYRRFPEIHLMTARFSDSAKNSFLNQDLAGKDDTGFPSISQAFTINKTHSFSDPAQWHSGFQIPDMMNKLISYLAPSVGDSPPSILDDIDDVAQRVGDRLRHFTKRFVIHSQLWFLPKVVGSDLTKRMMAFGATILHNEWLGEHFDVLSVIGDWKNTFRRTKAGQAVISGIQGTTIPLGTGGGLFMFSCPSSHTNLKDCIESAEATSRARGRGLIILAQNMLQLGISLKCVDIVALLDGGTDADERIQKMYRALTESTNKKAGFVIDLNYFRSVQAITEYQIQSFKARNMKNPGQEDLHSMLNNILRMYSINDNKPLFTSEGERNLEIAELKKRVSTGTYKTSTTLLNAGEAINRNVEEHFLFTQSDMDILSEYKEKDKKLNKEFLRKDEEIIKHAKELKDKETKDDVDNDSEDDFKLPNERSAREATLRRIASGQQIFKTLIRMGTFGSNSESLEDYKNLLKSNPDEQKVLYDLLIQRKIIKPSVSQETIFNAFIFPQLEKYLAKSEGSSYKTMKKIVDDPNKYPDKTEEVLEYINKHLAPKDEERKQLGQVYTPLTLVNDMLDTLPSSVWKNKDLKWLDPANGMGNFPIMAFLRLDKGLESEIPNVKERRTHIIKNMLFMLEIDPKNVRISKQLFNKIAPGVEPNILRTDSIAITFLQLISKGFPEKFDVIMGNPPYNSPKGESGSNGNNIWTKFVMKSYYMLNDKGYLLFVHPPGWRKPTNDVFNPEKFSSGDFTGQIRQGQVWQVLKDSGAFKFIYTNDEPVGKGLMPHFPAVDYYLYEKGGDKLGFDTKNVFIGTIVQPKGVRLNYNLKYIPNLITKQTQDILHKVTSKEGDKSNFDIYRDKTSDFFIESSKGKYRYIYTYNTKKEPQYKYSDNLSKDDNVNMDKVIMNYGGGIDSFTVQYIDDKEKTGSFHMTMYSKVESDKDGKRLEVFFNSDIVKFIFLITQYASGERTKNEPLVANSITIPPEGTKDYYKFFGIEEHRKYIEDILAQYKKFKAPKRVAKTEKAKDKKSKERRVTRKLRRV